MTMKGSRPLTDGEIEMARSVFGDAIEYTRVRIIRGKWWPFQPRNVVMAPAGNIHFHPRSTIWSDDFSKARLSLQGLFIHEMTHVWQSQKRGRLYLPLMRHPFCRYGFALHPARRFEDYGLEQQAEIVRQVFMLRGASPGTGPTLAALENILPFDRPRH